MNEATTKAFEAIKAAVASGQERIAPATFTPFFGRVATSQAFKIAKRESVIVVAYKSVMGTPVYKGAGK